MANGHSTAGPLTLDTCISKAAQLHSEWMRVNDKGEEHYEDGKDWSTRCQSAGCACAAENVFAGGMAPSDAFNIWKTSPRHNSIMLGPYTKIGIGISGGYVAANFQ